MLLLLHIRSRRFVRVALLFVLAAVLAGCASPEPAVRPGAISTEPSGDPVVTVTILQLNDVYEITPVEGGASGGLARVATLRKQLQAENPHTLTLIAGDFFSPSAMGTARVDGERLRGRQMVDALNAMGLDLATFGNHEFDLDEADFRSRMQESDFAWTSANVRGADGHPLPGTSPYEIYEFDDPAGTVRVGVVGVTLPANPADYVRYTDPLDALKRTVATIDDRVDVLVALTHLDIEADIRVAEQIPEIDLILGGHEHENVRIYRGKTRTPIVKADANARSVYIHDLRVNTDTGALTIDSRFRPVTAALADDPATAAVVQGWVERAFAGFRADGFDPEAVVAVTTVPLDGLEASVRNRPTLLTELIAEAIHREADGSRVGLYNSGSIRIDDVLPPGPVTQYDVIRALPFGGDVLTVEMRGSLLDSVLTQGVANRGTGGYLHAAGVANEGGAWRIDGAPIDPEGTYTVGISDFLMTGLETNLGYLTFDHPGVRRVATNRDVRMAFIDALRRRFGEG